MAAGSSRGSNKVSLEEDAIVAQLRPDPGAPAPNLLTFDGYLGKDVRDTHVRLYESEALDSYLLMPVEAIVRRVELPTGGSRLTLASDADVKRVAPLAPKLPVPAPAGHTTLASFVQGDITALIHELDANSQGAQLMKAGLGLSIPTFCNFWCHTLGGGYTCPVNRGGQRLHDSLNVDPCAYTLGFDPGCKEGMIEPAPSTTGCPSFGCPPAPTRVTCTKPAC